MSHKKVIIAGLIAGIIMNIAGGLSFGLVGVGPNTDKILVKPGVQNDKIVAVWTQIEPLPLSVTDPWILVLGYLVFGVALAYVYRWFSWGWENWSKQRKAWAMTTVLVLMYMFWEMSTPINLFSEPLQLVVIDVVFWLFMAVATGFGLVYSYEWINSKNLRSDISR